eukprot:12884857-Prorocentrum_lima.AAC.1
MLGVCMEALPEQDVIEVSAYSSFAPGGERSRTGWGGSKIVWCHCPLGQCDAVVDYTEIL